MSNLTLGQELGLDLTDADSTLDEPELDPSFVTDEERLAWIESANDCITDRGEAIVALNINKNAHKLFTMEDVHESKLCAGIGARTDLLFLSIKEKGDAKINQLFIDKTQVKALADQLLFLHEVM